MYKINVKRTRKNDKNSGIIKLIVILDSHIVYICKKI